MAPVYGAPGVDSIMKRPYSGWNVGTAILRQRQRARRRRAAGDSLVRAAGRDGAHGGIELLEDLGLAEGQRRVLRLAVEGDDHVLDLRRD